MPTYRQPAQVPLVPRRVQPTAKEGRSAIVGLVMLAGRIRSADLVRWLRDHGWTRGQGETDLRKLVKTGVLGRGDGCYWIRG